jgi:hypothetical protein
MPHLHILLSDSTATRLEAVPPARASTCSNDGILAAWIHAPGELHLATSAQLEHAVGAARSPHIWSCPTPTSSSSNGTRGSAGANAPRSVRNRASPRHRAVDARAGERALASGAISAAIIEFRAISKATVPRGPAPASMRESLLRGSATQRALPRGD